MFMKDAASNWLYEAQRHYRHGFDMNIQQAATFKVRDYIPLNHPKFAANASHDAGKMANPLPKKLLQ